MSFDGDRLTDPRNIAAEVVAFFMELMGTFDSNVHGVSLNILKGLLPYRVNEEQKALLTKLVTCEEVKNTLWSMRTNSALGLDGFNVHFLKNAWSIVGLDFTHAILNFFKSSKLLGSINITSVSLLPKVPNPTSMIDFRPFFCCNVVHKCI